jgi:NADH-quinone oxidoreductase subunit A
MKGYLLLLPPVAFLILLLVNILCSYLFSKIAFKKQEQSAEEKSSYACGEDFPDAMIQPDYSQFFPFAFFFTILHVIALVIATVPIETFETVTIAFVYLIGAVISLFILLRR